MSTSYPITFQLNADDRASDAMRAVVQVMHEGSSASDEAKQKFQTLRDGAVLQSRAMNTLGLEWKVNNANLYMFGRTMQSIGAIGNQLLTVVNSLILAQIAMAQINQRVSESTNDAAIYWQQYKDSLATWGETSTVTQGLLRQAISAQNEANATTAQAKQQIYLMNVQYLGIALSLGSFIELTIIAAKSLSGFVRGLMGAGDAASSLAGGQTTLEGALTGVGDAATVSAGALAAGAVAAAALGVGFGTLVGVIGDITTKGMTGQQAIQDINDKMYSLNPVLGVISQGVTGLFGIFGQLGNVVRNVGPSFAQSQNIISTYVGQAQKQGIILLTNWRNTWQTMNTIIGVSGNIIQNNARQSFIGLNANAYGIWQQLQQGWTAIWTGVQTTLSTAISNITTAFSGIKFTWPTIPNIDLGSVGAALGPTLGNIITVFANLPIKWPKLPNIDFSGMMTALTITLDNIKTNFNTLITWLSGLWPSISNINLSSIISTLTTDLGTIQTNFTGLVTWLGGLWPSIANIDLSGVISDLNKSLKTITDAFNSTMDAIRTALKDLGINIPGGSTSTTTGSEPVSCRCRSSSPRPKRGPPRSRTGRPERPTDPRHHSDAVRDEQHPIPDRARATSERLGRSRCSPG